MPVSPCPPAVRDEPQDWPSSAAYRISTPQAARTAQAVLLENAALITHPTASGDDDGKQVQTLVLATASIAAMYPKAIAGPIVIPGPG